MYRTWAVQSYGNNIAIIVKTSALINWRNLFHVIAFLKKYSKKLLFDYSVGIHRRKEDFLKKKNVMYLLSYKDHYSC